MKANISTVHLTGGRLLARNTLWSLLGQVMPMFAAVICVPPLIRGLGVSRFGLLSIAWVIIGYFGLFDLGVGRAVTKLVADRLALEERETLPSLIGTALFLMLIMGVFGGVVMCCVCPWIVRTCLKTPLQLQSETIRAFYILAGCIPFVTLTSGLRGILEAHQRFALANLIRMPMSVFSYLGPLIVVPFSSSLVPTVVLLFVGRLIGFIAHFIACLEILQDRSFCCKTDAAEFRKLIQFGGWITAANLLWPLIGYVDRFLVSGILSVAALAYYTTPVDMATRLTVIPGALSSVMFPAFAMSLNSDPQRASVLLNRSLKYILFLMFPIVLVGIVFAPEILRLWLGTGFAEQSTVVLRYVTAGVFISCFSQLPLAFVQSANRPDLTAGMYLLELPLFVGLLWLLTHSMGLQGAAIAWSIRVAADAAILFGLTHFLFPVASRRNRWLLGAVTASGVTFLVGSCLASLEVRCFFTASVLALFGYVVWFYGLDLSERKLIAPLTSIQSFVSHSNTAESGD